MGVCVYRRGERKNKIVRKETLRKREKGKNYRGKLGCVDVKGPRRKKKKKQMRQRAKRYEKEVGKEHKARDRNKGASVSVCHA